MADIESIEEVSVGDYRVRVGKADGCWEAVVVETGDSRATPGMLDPRTAGLSQWLINDIAPSQSDNSVSDAPPVEAAHRWVAAGLAVEAYEWGAVGEEPETGEDLYGGLRVGGYEIGQVTDMDVTVDASDFPGDSDD